MNRDVYRFLILLQIAILTLSLSACGGSSTGGSGGGLQPLVDTSGSIVAGITDPATGAFMPLSAESGGNPDNLQTVLGATISSPPEISFAVADEKGKSIDLNYCIKNNTCGVSFVIAQLDNGTYKSYLMNNDNHSIADILTPDKIDNASKFKTLSPGVYWYKFDDITSAPTAFDASKTHTIAIQIWRMKTNSNGKTVVQTANPYKTFVPNKSQVTQTRQYVSTSACNDCHGELQYHDNGWSREVSSCILCHSLSGYKGNQDIATAVTKSGYPFEFTALIHKVHMGKKIPGRTGNKKFDNLTYSTRTALDNQSNTPIDCTACHKQGTDIYKKDSGSNAIRWQLSTIQNKRDAAVCLTCHVNLPAGHSDTSQFNFCNNCHSDTPSSGIYRPFTNSHKAIENIALNNKDNTPYFPVTAQIISIDNHTNGNKPRVSVRLTANGLPYNVTNDDNISVVIGFIKGSNIDFSNDNFTPATQPGQPIQKTITTTTAKSANDYIVSFDSAITNGVSGVVFVQGSTKIKKDYSYNNDFDGKYKNSTFSIAITPAYKYFDILSGADLQSNRRVVVDTFKCNTCHKVIYAHSNTVKEVNQCIVCHNPNASFTTKTAKFDNGSAISTVDFKTLIHGLHNKPLKNLGRTGRDCNACHVNNSHLNKLTDNNVAGYFDNVSNKQIGAYQATCGSCHTNAIAQTHITSKISLGVEYCQSCHTSGLLNGVDSVHKKVR